MKGLHALAPPLLNDAVHNIPQFGFFHGSANRREAVPASAASADALDAAIREWAGEGSVTLPMTPGPLFQTRAKPHHTDPRLHPITRGIGRRVRPRRHPLDIRFVSLALLAGDGEERCSRRRSDQQNQERDQRSYHFSSYRHGHGASFGARWNTPERSGQVYVPVNAAGAGVLPSAPAGGPSCVLSVQHGEPKSLSQS